MKEFHPTGRILVAPHSRVTQRSPKRNVQCPHAAEQMVTDDQAPASCSSHAAVGLVTAINEKDHSNTLIGCSQVVVDLEQPHGASGEHLTCLGWPDPGSDPGVALVGHEVVLSLGLAPNLPTSIRDPGSAPRQPSAIDIHKEWHHVPYAEVLRSGITAADAGIPGAGATPQQEISKVVWHPASDVAFPISGSSNATDETGSYEPLMPIQSIIVAEHWDAQGGTIGLDVNVISHALSSAPRVGSPSLDPQGGDPRSGNSISSLRRNILEFRKYLICPATHGTEVFYDGHDTPSDDFRLKPILKKPKKPKKKHSPSSHHHG
ncbi:hypothetical protein Nepgr_026571 [Nepenthes gracilis]|uniref:Uncharacterized protein n=1 Tax=Nepenthes gracilis TaxID=150966 RepID=A0AAD3T8B4_NEPGR|nr:hypothetical protein Nepgr_026571 [Nepenthes gracilis]